MQFFGIGATIFVAFVSGHIISSDSTKDKVVSVNSCSDKQKNNDNMSKTFRSILKVVPQQPRHWVGNGFHVHPVFGENAFTESISPWLMFDYGPPKQFPGGSSEQRGVGKHPHRGFETITIAWQGSVEHADSVGNSGVIGPKDVQWMTAGRGIVHEEYQSIEFAKTGGTFEMCQLWLNLPAKDKMTPPKYQPIVSSDIPVVQLRDEQEEKLADVRVIAGTLQKVIGPASTFSPVELWDVLIKKQNSLIQLDIPSSHNVIIFVRKGRVLIAPDNTSLGPQSVALMKREEGGIGFIATEPDSQVLIMGGEPLNEPIAARGPFVMNTSEELRKAMMDYQTGRMGK